MKKFILLILIIAVTLGCCLSFSACGPIEQPEIPVNADLAGTILKPDGRSIEECTPEENLYMASHVMTSLGFRATNNGTSKAVGVSQQVRSERTVLNGAVAITSTSLGFLSLGKQLYFENDSYVVREAKKVKSIDNVEWEETAKRVSREGFQSLYGLPPNGLTSFVVNADSLKEAKYAGEENGIYTFEYRLDHVVSVFYLKYQMRTYSGSKGFPVFDEDNAIRMTVKMDKDRKVSAIYTVCNYKVDMLGGVKCEEKMEEFFYDAGKVSSIPERVFFADYLNAGISDAEQEETAMNVLMDTFMPMIADGVLSADIKISGLITLEAKAQAVIDLENLDNLTVDLLIPDWGLEVSYRSGRVFLRIDQLHAYLDVNDLTRESESDGAEITEEDTQGLLDRAKLKKDGNNYTVLLPLGGFEVEINSVKDEQGDFSFVEAVLGPLVVNIDTVAPFETTPPDEDKCVSLLPLVKQFLSKEDSIDFSADILGLLSANVSIPLDGGNVKALVEIGDEKIYADFSKKQLALRYDDLKVRLPFKDALTAIFTRFYEVDFMAELINLLGGLSEDSIELTWGGVSKMENRYVLSIGTFGLVLELCIEETDQGLAFHSVRIPLGGDKAVTLTLSERRDYSAIENTDDYPNGMSLLDIVDDNFSIDLGLALDEYNARLKVNLNSLTVELCVKPRARSELLLSVQPDETGVQALYFAYDDLKLLVRQKEFARYGQLLGTLVGEHKALLGALIEAVMTGGNTPRIEAGTSVDGETLTIGISINEFNVRLNFSTKNGRLSLSDLNCDLNGFKIEVTDFEKDESDFGFISDTTDFVDCEPLFVLDDTLEISINADFNGLNAKLTVDLLELSAKAVVEDVYENNLFVSFEKGELRFKYGELCLKAGTEGIDRLIDFVTPLLGDESIVDLISAVGSKLDVYEILNSVKIDAAPPNGCDMECGMRVGDIYVAVYLNETNGKYYFDNFAASSDGMDLKLTICEAPDFSELNGARDFLEVTTLLDMFSDNKLALKIDVKGLSAKIGLDIATGEVFADVLGLSAMYYRATRDTIAGPEKYGRALLKYGALEAQVDAARLLSLLPKIREKLGNDFLSSEIIFDASSLANGIQIGAERVCVSFNLIADKQTITISLQLKITEQGLVFDSANVSVGDMEVSATLCDFGGFFPFDKETEYLDLNMLAEDYLDVLLSLAATRSWSIAFSGNVMMEKSGGETKQTENLDFELQVKPALSSENKLSALFASLEVFDAATAVKRISLDVAYRSSQGGPDSSSTDRIFVDYNGLKASLKTDVFDELPEIFERACAAIPALSTLLEDMTAGLKASFGSFDPKAIFKDVRYENGELLVTLAGTAFADGVDDLTLKLSQRDGSLRLEAEGLKLSNSAGLDRLEASANIVASTSTEQSVLTSVSSAIGDTSAYTPFDSITDLLNVLLNTVEKRHISAKGTAAVKISIITMDIPCSIEADIADDGRITAVVELKISGKIPFAFNSLGSHTAYVYVDSHSPDILMKRSDNKYKKVAAAEFGDKALECLYFLTDLGSAVSDAIDNAVAKAPDNPFKLEKVFKSYAYAENNFAFNIDLSSFNPTLGVITLDLTHDTIGVLSKISAAINLNLTESIKGNINLNLNVRTQGVSYNTAAKVEAEQNSARYN